MRRCWPCLPVLFAAAASAQAPPPSGAAATPPRVVSGTIGEADYPRAALRGAVSGASEVRVAIAPDGAPTGCSVVRSSGSALLDQRACAILTTRFRYEPARSAAGAPIAGALIYTIDWRVRTTTVRRRGTRIALPPPETAAGPGRPPRLRSGYIVSYDYPAGAYERGQQGDTAVELAIDARGRTTACTVVQSSGHTALDERACDLFLARFVWTPARDAAGRRAPSRVTQRISWRLPEGDRKP